MSERASRAPGRARDAILSRRAASGRVRVAQRSGERVVFTSGCFDLLHVGHLRSLEQARSFGDRLLVGVNSDASVRRMKGPSRPIVPARQRAELLAGLSCVDWVVLFGEDTPRPLLSAILPDVYAKGGDWPIAVLRENDAPPGWDGEIRRLRQVPGVRTSLVLDRIAAKRPAAAGRRTKRGR